MTGGIERYTPVKGGDNFSSRYKCETIEEKLAPADIPPTMKPLPGFTLSSSMFDAVYFISIYSPNSSRGKLLPISKHQKHHLPQ